MHTKPSPLPSIDPSRLYVAALSALGTGGTPRSSREARRVAHAELFAAFRDEGDEDVPSVDDWEVRALEWALHPVFAREMHATRRYALCVAWDQLVAIVPAEHARLALFLHGIYPVTREGRTIWGCDLAHAGEPAVCITFAQFHWACGQLAPIGMTHLGSANNLQAGNSIPSEDYEQQICREPLRSPTWVKAVSTSMGCKVDASLRVGPEEPLILLARA
jgi:hypothetical protein